MERIALGIIESKNAIRTGATAEIGHVEIESQFCYASYNPDNESLLHKFSLVNLASDVAIHTGKDFRSRTTFDVSGTPLYRLSVKDQSDLAAMVDSIVSNRRFVKRHGSKYFSP